MAEMGGPGGDLGADRYRAGIAKLLKDAPAYAKYDQAVRSGQQGRYRLGQAACGRGGDDAAPRGPLPRVQGELELHEKDAKGALPYLEKARSLDPTYFKPIALAGIAQYDLGNRGAAEPLLNQAMQLLPNGPSAYYLGRIAEDNGNTAKAVEYYKMVAGSKSKLGQEAQARLARLDLAQNPDTYLAIEPQLDQSGHVWLTVGNRTNVPVRNVSLQVAVVNQAGQVHSGPVRVTTGGGVIPPAAGGAPADLARAVQYARGVELRQVEGRERAAGAIDFDGSAFSAPAAARLFVRCIRSRRVGQLFIERLTIAEAAAQELRPARNNGKGIGSLRQQAPQSRVMPAQFVAGRVAVLPYAAPELADLRYQLGAGHSLEVVVHRCRPRDS